MNLKPLAFIPGMVLAGLAHAQVRSASVVYTFRDSQSQPAYRLGDECFVPVDALTNWGWKVDKKGDAVNLTLEGHTVHLDTRFVGGKLTIPLRKAITEVGGSSSWTAGTDNLSVFSVLSDLSVRDLKVHAEGGLPFKAKAFYLSPGKTVIDLEGVRLGSETHEDLPDNVKAVQYRPNEVRLTVNTAFIPKLPDEAASESTEFDYQILKDQDLAEAPPGTGSENHVAITSTDPTPPPRQRPVRNVVTPTVSPFDRGNQQTGGPPGSGQQLTVSVDSETETATVLGIHLPVAFAGQTTINRPDPASLEVILPTTAQLPIPFAGSRAVQDLTVRPMGARTSVLIHFVRSMGAEVINEANGVTINLFQPRIADSRLQGKLIIVDPGHGGHDRGAHDGLVNEKDLNLSIGLKLAQELTDAGATVILTRKDDTFIPLTERSNIANRNHADLFISCHINSTGGSGNQSGTITFHHKGSRISKFLAECIQDQIRRVNGLPNKGVMSDGVIYNSGFSVLRQTNTTCVLIEMGFINNDRDRARMVTQDFQDSVARAVVKGIRVYLGDIKPNE